MRVLARSVMVCFTWSAFFVVSAQFHPATQGPSNKRVTVALDGGPLRIEQPEAMVPFYEHLFQLTSDQSSAVHILHFGDSHTAGDEWTGPVRSLFKEQFGDGGSGFSVAGTPFPGYRRFDAVGGSSGAWRSSGLRSASGDGYFGLGGVSISTTLVGQSVFLEAQCDAIEIQYLQQPGGGDFAVYDGDQVLGHFSTDGRLGPGFVRYPTSLGLHKFILKTLSARPVRLFGWAADKNHGITYEALGLNGAEASVMLRWDAAMFTSYVQRRNPALIVLAYGTNEAVSQAFNLDRYQTMFSTILQRLRRAAPTASILVIGPPDGYVKSRGKWQLLAGVDAVTEAQARASRTYGCAFWDTRERMGGIGSMRDWVSSGQAQGDYIHFTVDGYHRLAAVLFADIMKQYEKFKAIRIALSEPIPDRLFN